MFSELLGYIGDTWDPNTNNVNATEEVWQHFYTINKSDYKLFKREGCKHYHALGEIFSGKRDWISTHKEGSSGSLNLIVSQGNFKYHWRCKKEKIYHSRIVDRELY
ncbi:uncharacterized protein LOC111387543 isoform X2 [Olea europaea var. sylvestris]|uniref:uncharacterized protein LOC111387543 isoform X2 n=1 Tax=Olea europaea var. sylvestris TaxID=158386 RepID=UPI000C1D07B2|nr:uncharacterized protein LOC111387543 isoform X2 [Olea europaea var. sylvestris]